MNNKEILLKKFRGVWDNEIEEELQKIKYAEEEYGLQQLNNFYEELRRTWEETWQEFLQMNYDYNELEEEEQEELYYYNIIDYIF